MADPICRWRNTSIKQVSEFTQVLPHCPMRKDAARAFVEKQWHEWDGGNGFFRTPYQLAAQLGLYYEDDTMFYPRFDHVLSINEARIYIEGWIRRYYIPNPYTGSIHYDGQPVVLNSQLYQAALSGEFELDDFFRSRLDIDLGNKDILTNILNNFSDIKVENGWFGIKKETIIGDLVSQNKSDDKKAFFDTFNDILKVQLKVNTADNFSRQIIYYGAPGTGKSHKIKEILGEYEGCPVDKKVPKENIFRTTFHPDSDYSTFVGAYKPTMKKQYRYEGKVKASYYEDDDLANAKKGDPVIEKVIEYNFIPQAFLNAYIRAYKTNKNVYLIIEEINRGNCAQIFGDLFQLLDRDENGKSEYTIKADADLETFLEGELGEASKESIKEGELCLPSNLYIYATMNTSDQSLFPIDSAFKRRWDWKYIPIAKGKDNDGVELNWMIVIDGKKYDWWTFVKTINKHVFDTTNSEDKQLGFFFCKAKGDIIDAETFVGKVVFYLWNDVFKDFGFDAPIFADKEDETNPKLSFDKFYYTDGKVNESKVTLFFTNIGLAPLTILDDSDTNEFLDEDGNTKDTVSKDFSKYSINGVGSYSKGKVVQQAVEMYANAHPDMSAEQFVEQWMGLKVNVPNFIESKATYETRVMQSKDTRVHEKAKSVTLPNGDIIYVSNQYNPSRIKEFILKVNAANWGITIEKV